MKDEYWILKYRANGVDDDTDGDELAALMTVIVVIEYARRYVR